MARVQRFVLIAVAFAAAACDETSGRLYVDISSSLSIPGETNTLVVRVTGPNGSEEKSYTLGEAPRDVWPQVLPILGDKTEKSLTIAAELRLLRSGMPSVAVGYGEMQAIVPSNGEARVALDVARACEDRDGDGYGNGFGCANPDCDDTRNDVPFPTFCPNQLPPPNDAGLPPDHDAGQEDSGVPSGDSGIPDPPDSGVPGPPDAGTGLICELVGTTCPADQVCFSGRCWDPCATDLDCTNLNEACLEAFNICVCRVPCDPANPSSCIIGTCNINGCCDF